MEIGPVEYMIVGFPGNKFRGEIAPALAELVESGTIRILDLAFVLKDPEGEVAFFELSQLEPEFQSSFGSLEADTAGLLNEEDLAAAAEELEPDSSAALLVWEDVWAAKLAQAMRDADGVLLDLERVPHEVAKAAFDWAVANR